MKITKDQRIEILDEMREIRIKKVVNSEMLVYNIENYPLPKGLADEYRRRFSKPGFTRVSDEIVKQELLKSSQKKLETANQDFEAVEKYIDFINK